ncbi:MAG: hypothetical protein QM689_08010 [Oscillospiraceae bacterium]
MYSKLALKQMKKRLIVTALVVCQFALVIFLIGMISGRIASYFEVTTMMKGLCGEQDYYIYENISYGEYINEQEQIIYDKYFGEALEQLNDGTITSEQYKAIHLKVFDQYEKELKEKLGVTDGGATVLDKLPYIKRTAAYCDGTAVNGDDKYYIRFFNNTMAQAVDAPMARGDWLDEAGQDASYLNVVAVKGTGYKVGDVIPLCLYEKNWDEATDTITERTGKQIQAKVVGLLNNEQFISYGIAFGGNDNGNCEELSEAFMDTNFSDDFYAIYDPNSQFFSDYKEKYDKYMQSMEKGMVVTLKDAITPAEKAEFDRALSDNHLCSMSMKNTYDNSLREEKKLFQNDMVFLIAAALISIIGMIGVSAISSIREIRTYSIYYIHGMTWKGALRINGAAIFRTMLYASILSVLIKLGIAGQSFVVDYAEYSDMGSFSEMMLDSMKFTDYFFYTPAEVLGSVVLVVVASLCAMIIPVYILKTNPPVRVLKGN